MDRDAFERRRLVCPACRARLVLEAKAVRCTGCGLVYPVRDGIPVLLVSEAAPGGREGK